jgi:hypothetical protein
MAQKFLTNIDVSGKIVIDGSIFTNGSTVLDVQGSQGQLFSVTNSLSGDLFSISDISGIPILNVNSSGLVTVDGDQTVDGHIKTITGNSTGKFAVMSTGVHSSYDFYNDGTSYLNGAVTVDAAFTQTGGAASTFSGTLAATHLSVASTTAADIPLILGSSNQTNYTLQQWQTSAHAANEAYILAYGASHTSQAGNFAMKNIESGGEIFFELAAGVEPLRLTSTGSTFAGAISTPTGSTFAGAIKITETGTAQHILIGNQDSAGTDKPSMIMGVNGALKFGYGNSWVGEGGTFTPTLTLDTSSNATFAGNIAMAANATVDGVDISALPTTFAPTNAEQNVQSDWTEATTTSDAFILNKPTIPTDYGDHANLYLPIGGGTLTDSLIIKDTNATTTTTGTTLLELWNVNTSDNQQQQSFIDFKFTDTNANFTPQVRIGAQVGPDADANAISKEGAGSFVVYTAPIGSDETGGSTGLAEQFRVSYDGTSTFAGNIVMAANSTVDGVDISGLPTSFAPTDAEANVQADWNETTTTSDAFILNKPTIPAAITDYVSKASGGTFGGAITVTGELEATSLDINGNADISGNLLLGSAGTENFISFAGTTGDTGGTTFIGEYLYGGTEKSELILYKGNDGHASTASPDRIRMIGANLCFDVYNVAQSYPTTMAGVAGLTTIRALTIDQTKLATFTGNISLSGTGIKSIQSGGDIALKTSTGEYALYGAANGNTNLYYNGVQHFRTGPNGVVVTGDVAVGGSKYTLTVNAPTSLTTSVVNDTINVTFTASTTTNIDNYLVFSSVAGGDYGLISVIPPADFGATMSIIDDSFNAGGTQAYRVYAVKNGVYSSPLTGSQTFTVGTVEPTNMSVINLNTAFYIQYDAPSAKGRFVTAYNIYKHEHATQSSLDRNSATLIYSGINNSYMYQISGNNNDNFHKFWVETTVV